MKREKKKKKKNDIYVYTFFFLTMTGTKGDRGFPGLKGDRGECTCSPTPEEPNTRPFRNNNGETPSRGKVAFSAARTTSLLATNGPIILTYQTIFTNKGGHFDEETGIFNCVVPGQ